MKSPRTVNASLLTNRQTRSNYILAVCGGRKVISVLILVMFHSWCNIVLSNFIFRIAPSLQEREEDWGSPKRVPDNQVQYSKLKVEHFVAKQTKGFTEIVSTFLSLISFLSSPGVSAVRRASYDVTSTKAEHDSAPFTRSVSASFAESNSKVQTCHPLWQCIDFTVHL